MLSAPTVKVLSERNIGFIQNCIAECEPPSEPVALDLPTRLLDLEKFQLVDSACIPQGISSDERKYAALSYCWGDAETAKQQSVTTLSNLEDRKSGFDVEKLSPVVQDAIDVSPQRPLFQPHIERHSISLRH